MQAPICKRPDRRLALCTLAGLGAAIAGCAAAGSNPPPQRLGLSAEDEALARRFRGIPKGGELRVDATFDTQMRQVVTQANGVIFVPAMGNYGPGRSGTSGYFGDEKYGLPLPKTLRYQRYADDAPRWHNRYSRGPMFKGPFVVDVTVPVATRIPDAVLDRIRKYKGASLKLKLRMTRETLLVGWEVRNGPDYPYPRDAKGNRIMTDADFLIGGDFCEKRVQTRHVNGKLQTVVFKGWQIDPRTGQRVETDF